MGFKTPFTTFGPLFTTLYNPIYHVVQPQLWGSEPHSPRCITSIMGFGTPFTTLYNPNYGVLDPINALRNPVYPVVQPQLWGSEPRLWGSRPH